MLLGIGLCVGARDYIAGADRSLVWVLRSLTVANWEALKDVENIC